MTDSVLILFTAKRKKAFNLFLYFAPLRLSVRIHYVVWLREKLVLCVVERFDLFFLISSIQNSNRTPSKNIFEFDTVERIDGEQCHLVVDPCVSHNICCVDA